MKAEIMDILGHQAHLRVLLVLRARGPMRFTQIQETLGLNPVQVDRALKALRDGFWIFAETAPANKGRIQVEYQIGKRGAALLRAFDSFFKAIEGSRSAIRVAEVRTLENLYA
ncbi:MAG: hypothetical protein HY556_12045 [Euryarchaeota archaeon]|nr:hypothetical protein [Euryarchaeota archaeon]